MQNKDTDNKNKQSQQNKVNTKDLQSSIDRLADIVEKRSTLWYRLWSGLVTGLATAIGATVIAGAVVYILGSMIKQIDLSYIPFLQEIIEASNLLE